MTSKDYYANKNGFQLREFITEIHKSETRNNNYRWTTPQGFYALNALKYIVRAGNKPQVDLEDDMKKYNDYIELGETVGFPRYEIELYVTRAKAIFDEWNGEEIDF